MGKVETNRASLYGEVTARVIAKLEAGRLPWAQPWDSAACGCTMLRNAGTGRRYSGINVLILWAAVVAGGYASQRWLTYAQAQAAGGTVRRGEKGTVVYYADRFTPKAEAARAVDEDREARQIAFLKRFTVFNIDQCEGLPEALTAAPEQPAESGILPQVQALIAASGADIRMGGDKAYYAPAGDFVVVPPMSAFPEPVNWHRTALHELGHYAARRFMPRGCRKRRNFGLPPRGMRHNLGASRALAQPANDGYGCAHGNQTADEEALRGTGGPGLAGEA